MQRLDFQKGDRVRVIETGHEPFEPFVTIVEDVSIDLYNGKWTTVVYVRDPDGEMVRAFGPQVTKVAYDAPIGDGMVVPYKSGIPYDVDITRSGPWGNPYTHIPLHLTRARWQVPTQEESVQRFEEWVKDSTDLEAEWIRENVGRLYGKVLGCSCKRGKPCHGTVLLRLAKKVHDDGSL